MVTIRDAKKSDAKTLCEAEKQIAKTPGFMVSHPEELKESDYIKKIETLTKSANSKYIVAEINAVLVGHALLEPMPLQAIQHIVRLTIMVHPGHEERGIGSAMLEYLISWAKTSTGVEKIELNVRSINLRALRLYQKFGFALESRLKNRIKIGDHQYIDDLQMGLFVKDNPKIKTFVAQPIGIIISSRKNIEDDNWDEVECSIQLDSKQFSTDTLVGLDSFSHIEVIYHMNQVDVRKVELGSRHPRNNSNWPKIGIFSQRGKNRPNQIGTTICKILDVNGLRIRVQGLDAIDGSPVLDIKPWVNEFGPRGKIIQPEWMTELMREYWKKHE